MSNVLLINSSLQETRVALVENGEVAEFYVERQADRSIVGNIYKGKVLRVLPGMQAAFVDIGLDRAAFLYVTDVQDDFQHIYLGEEGEGASIHNSTAPESSPIAHKPLSAAPLLDTPDDAPLTNPSQEVADVPKKTPIPNSSASPAQLIQDLLVEGQEIVVQVAKAPMGTKGARVSSHVSLPGRNLVLIPSVDHIGISRRIGDKAERDRLREIVERIKPAGMGFIVRTACEGKSEQAIREDMQYLSTLWQDIWQKNQNLKAPQSLHQDLDLVLRAARDFFTPYIDRLVIDDVEVHNRVKKFIHTFLPKLKDSLELYQGNEPLFDAFNIEADIERALGRKVWLKSGGYIIIDQMEALTAIDINTGRFVGKRNLEDTILKTNLEALREVATQLRLRNIGGIIIIDFIDMVKKTNRERVSNALEEALKMDRAKTNILQISELGLVEMTRKRTQESLVRHLCSPCPYCEGKAYVKSPHTVCYEVFRTLRRDYPRDKKPREIVLIVHPAVADLLADEERKGLDQIESGLGCKISIKAKPDFHLEQHEIIAK